MRFILFVLLFTTDLFANCDVVLALQQLESLLAATNDALQTHETASKKRGGDSTFHSLSKDDTNSTTTGEERGKLLSWLKNIFRGEKPSTSTNIDDEGLDVYRNSNLKSTSRNLALPKDVTIRLDLLKKEAKKEGLSDKVFKSIKEQSKYDPKAIRNALNIGSSPTEQKDLKYEQFILMLQWKLIEDCQKIDRVPTTLLESLKEVNKNPTVKAYFPKYADLSVLLEDVNDNWHLRGPDLKDVQGPFATLNQIRSEVDQLQKAKKEANKEAKEKAKAKGQA